MRWKKVVIIISICSQSIFVEHRTSLATTIDISIYITTF